MKYQCESGHVFIHPSKKIMLEKSESLASCTVADSYKSETLETFVCPFCQSLEYSEFAEPQPEIVSVKSVDLAEVDDWLLKGYMVESLYAKTATLIRKEVKKE